MWCGVVWCGVVRCSAEWFGAVWCGVVWGSRGDEIALRHREGELLYRHPRAAVRDNVPVQIIIINPPNRATFQSRDVSKHQRQSRRGIDPEWGLLLLHCHCFRLGTHTPRDPPDGGTHTNTQKDTNTRPPSLASPSLRQARRHRPSWTSWTSRPPPPSGTLARTTEKWVGVVGRYDVECSGPRRSADQDRGL